MSTRSSTPIGRASSLRCSTSRAISPLLPPTSVVSESISEATNHQDNVDAYDIHGRPVRAIGLGLHRDVGVLTGARRVRVVSLTIATVWINLPVCLSLTGSAGIPVSRGAQLGVHQQFGFPGRVYVIPVCPQLVESLYDIVRTIYGGGNRLPNSTLSPGHCAARCAARIEA